jgi:uroporphyrin-III C-methyltransferase
MRLKGLAMHAIATTPLAAGRCYLVGAGPGDPELLTLRAWRAIQAATLLLVDDLVTADIVALAPAATRTIYVGKRGGRASTSQAFIEKLMVMAARQGETVVRLKGGDPFIFGRGGEEVAHLQAQGVEVEVINGITSGLAAATSLGVPLTHRDYAHGVVFVTGHAKPGGAPLDWCQLGATAEAMSLSLVVYMGVAAAPLIEAGLLAGGLAPDTPVALVQNASLSSQRSVLTSLSSLVACLQGSGLGSPCMMVIGKVAGLADASLLWQGLVEPLERQA